MIRSLEMTQTPNNLSLPKEDTVEQKEIIKTISKVAEKKFSNPLCLIFELAAMNESPIMKMHASEELDKYMQSIRKTFDFS
jgi:hypothetical protein